MFTRVEYNNNDCDHGPEFLFSLCSLALLKVRLYILTITFSTQHSFFFSFYHLSLFFFFFIIMVELGQVAELVANYPWSSLAWVVVFYLAFRLVDTLVLLLESEIKCR